MKTNSFLRFGTILLFAVLIQSCSDNPQPALSLTSLKSGNTDLLASTPATNVNVNNNIVAVFSEDIDNATATTSTITLKKGTMGVDIQVSVSGSTGAGGTLNIDPVLDLDPNTEYTLTIGAVKSTTGKVHSTKTVTFTTAP